MELLSSFLSSHQSVRNHSFMFLWRILLCVLLTYDFMVGQGYVFDSKDITAAVIITFILSPQFLLAVPIYLIYVFIFFWLFKVIGVILSFVMPKKQMGVQQILILLERLHLVSKSSNDLGYIINKQQGIVLINNFIKDRAIIAKSEVLKRTVDYLNVITSTTFSFFCLYDDKPYFLHCIIFLLILNLFIACIAYKILYIYLKSDLLSSIKDELMKFGYRGQNF